MLLSPKTLAAIKNLPLLAKTVVDGFMMGANKSFQKGTGMEFSQYRSYQPGDDLRQLDWKLFARSDRYFIRQSEVETSITVRFVLDISASMNHEENGISKLDYAKFLAASLAHLAHTQGDATGLYALHKDSISSLTPRRDVQHMQRLFYQLEQLKANSTFPDLEQAKPLLDNSNGKELVILISDLYEQHQEISQLASRFKAYKNEVLVFHLMASNELNLQYPGNVTFEDWESGQTVEVATDSIRQNYQQALQKYLEGIRQQMHEKDLYYYLYTIDQPLDKALREFLIQRNRI